MQLTSIVVIVLRITALSWLVQGLTSLASVVIAMSPFPDPHPNYWSYGVPAIFFVFAVGTWLI